jgi:iron-sulfur cluster repair protein YtfE (RIC family)
MTLTELVDHIEATHHALLKREMPRLRAVFVEQQVDPALLDPFLDLDDLMRDHLMKEERILFPGIRGFESNEPVGMCGFEGPIRQMNYEHEQIEALVGKLVENAALAGAEQASLRALMADLHVHARLEEEELFPRALKMADEGPPDDDGGAGDSGPGGSGPGDSEPNETPDAPDRNQAMRSAIGAAVSWHMRARKRVDAIQVQIDAQDLSPRFMAPWNHFSQGVLAHFVEEETELFPALLALADGQEPTNVDHLDHLDDMQGELFEIRTIGDALAVATPEAGELEDTIRDLLDELETHAKMEEQHILPPGRALVDAYRGIQREPVGSRPTPTRRVQNAKGGALRRAARSLTRWVRNASGRHAM